jgi:arylsulfatase A-like enzyme
MPVPNFLVVFLDDHAQWASGCYGNREVRTPTLDHLARTGVRMADAFTPTPVCSPARACFLTGQLASQHGVHDYLNTFDDQFDQRAWLAGQVTLPQVLHDAGYTTALCGKWHLGRSFEAAPGFDYWYEHGAVESASNADGPWPARSEISGYDNHAITDRAVDFLRHRADDAPFFLFVGYFATHSPWSGHPERLVAQYRDCSFDDIPADLTYPFGRLASESRMPSRTNPKEALAQYYAAVSEVDEQVGRLLDELDNQSVREQTLIVYTSDHGLNTGHHGLWGKGNASKPYNMLEESIRVPLILNQPGALVGGQTRGEPVTHCDVFATMLDHAGLPLPGLPAAYPGRSFAELLSGGHVPEWPDAVFGEYGNMRMIRTSEHKLVRRYPDGPDELFDLRTDPRETVNRRGDPGFATLAADLDQRIDAYFAAYETPERSGLRVNDLPSFNSEEYWRNPTNTNAWWNRNGESAGKPAGKDGAR